MAENDPEVVALAACVNLDSVRLVSTHCEFFGLATGEGLNHLDVGIEAGGLKSPDRPQTLRVVVGADFSYLPAKDAKKVLVRVSCKYALDYQVADAGLFSGLSEQVIARFAARNGHYNAWPYLREYCQSTLARMQLLGGVLPSFRPMRWTPVAPDELRR